MCWTSSTNLFPVAFWVFFSWCFLASWRPTWTLFRFWWFCCSNCFDPTSLCWRFRDFQWRRRTISVYLWCLFSSTIRKTPTRWWWFGYCGHKFLRRMAGLHIFIACINQILTHSRSLTILSYKQFSYYLYCVHWWHSYSMLLFCITLSFCCLRFSTYREEVIVKNYCLY